MIILKYEIPYEFYGKPDVLVIMHKGQQQGRQQGLQELIQFLEKEANQSSQIIDSKFNQSLTLMENYIPTPFPSWQQESKTGGDNGLEESQTFKFEAIPIPE